jgi:hypothetical protein
MATACKRALLVLVFFVATIAPPSASAMVDCGAEENTFIRRTGVDLWGSYGVKGRNMIRDTSLGTCFPVNYNPERHSTVHIRASNSQDWIEIGWFKELRAIVPIYRGFVEWGINSHTVMGYREFGSDCSLNGAITPGHWARFHMYWKSSSSTWFLSYDDDDNGTYCTAGSYANVPFSTGLAIGETGRFGDLTTSVYDHFDAMQYTSQPNNAGWISFSNNVWYHNCIAGYGYHFLASDEWEIATGYPCHP